MYQRITPSVVINLRYTIYITYCVHMQRHTGYQCCIQDILDLEYLPTQPEIIFSNISLLLLINICNDYDTKSRGAFKCYQILLMLLNLDSTSGSKVSWTQQVWQKVVKV